MSITKSLSTNIDKEDQREYWAAHIQQWKTSGFKQQAYCTQAGISYSSFVYWKGILSAKQAHIDMKPFVPVKVIKSEAPIPDTSREIQIKLKTGHIVCIPTTMDPKSIATLIHFLGTTHA